MIVWNVVPEGRCKGRYTESSKANAAPRECPTNVTFSAPNLLIPVWTADKICVAVSACSSAKPLCTSTDEGTPGNKLVSRGPRKKSASVRSASLKNSCHLRARSSKMECFTIEMDPFLGGQQ